MSILPAALFEFDFFEPSPIQIEVSDAPLTSDAGLLPLRPFDEVVISARADAAFGIPDMYDVSEGLNILYTFGLTANRVLQQRSDALLARAVAAWEQERQAARQRHFRLRRQRDPLKEGHPCTRRTLLIKVAAEVVVQTRRIRVRLSLSWPHHGWYLRVCEHLRHPLVPLFVTDCCFVEILPFPPRKGANQPDPVA